MKKRLFAFFVVTLMLLSMPTYADEINPGLTATYASTGIPCTMDKPITRAEFCMLALESFRQLNSGVFPQMSASNPFSDVGSASEDLYVVMLYGMGVVCGTSSTTFEPRRPITRQEASTILARTKMRQNPDLMAETDGFAAHIASAPDASDVAAWAKAGVGYCVKSGILSLSDTKLLPAQTLSTGEALTLCTRFIAS